MNFGRRARALSSYDARRHRLRFVIVSLSVVLFVLLALCRWAA